MRKRMKRRVGLKFISTLFISSVILSTSINLHVAQAQTAAAQPVNSVHEMNKLFTFAGQQASEDYSTGEVINHTVVAGEYLNLIARKYGVTANELRLWNHLTTDLLQIGQVLKVIPNTTAPTNPDDHSGDVVNYTVKAGDTLWLISQRFGVTPSNLRLWNHLTTDILQIGQVLKVIPNITNPTYPTDPDDHSGDVVTYTVRAGDTLWSISNKFAVSINNLRLWNHLTTNLIRVGQQIKLIPPEPGPTQPEEPQNPTTYTVRAGDTLWSIASRSGVTVAHLRQWNNLTSNLLSIGQRLIVSGEAQGQPPAITRYTAKAGDTMWSISRRYNISVSQLKAWNGLYSDFLAVGQVLNVSQPRVTHLVKAGDSLWKIASQYGSTVEQIKNWNGLTTNTIYINQRLIVK